MLTKRQAKILLSNVSEKNKLNLVSGKSIYNLSELNNELKIMDDKSFSYHLNNNDFTNWINDNIKDNKLGTQIKSLNNKESINTIIEMRLEELKNIFSENNKEIKIIKIENQTKKEILNDLKKMMAK